MNKALFFTDKEGTEHFIFVDKIQAISSDPYTTDDGKQYCYVNVCFENRVNSYQLSVEHYKRLKDGI